MAMEEKVKNLKYIFDPKSVAVVGASDNPEKLGAVVLKNLLDGHYSGKIYPVNPKYPELLGLKCYADVQSIPGKLECVIIATPSTTVPQIIGQCAAKGVKGVVVLSGGFGEVGNSALEQQLKDLCNRGNMALVGPNCLGILNPHSRMDSVFMPFYKFERPLPGGISFVTQSGGVGSTIVDLAANYGVGISKFISYGNGTVLSESDFLEYLEKDDKTDTIILYLEGTKDGRRLFETLSRVNCKKPVVVLKAGRSEKAKEAARSHTGNMAGDYLAYKAAFRQAEVIEAESLEELFDFVKIFRQSLPRGDRVGVITNGGGIGVLTADALEREGLDLSSLDPKTSEAVKAILPSYANVGNPLDLVADAGVEVFEGAIEAFMRDSDVSAVIICVLFQVPTIDERLLRVLVRASDDKRKPIAVVAMGGGYTERQRKTLEGSGVPTYNNPLAAVKSVKKLVDYARHWNSACAVSPRKKNATFS